MTTNCPNCQKETLDFQLSGGDNRVPRGFFKRFTEADLMAQGCTCPLTSDEIEAAGAALVERVNAGRVQ